MTQSAAVAIADAAIAIRNLEWGKLRYLSTVEDISVYRNVLVPTNRNHLMLVHRIPRRSTLWRNHTHGFVKLIESITEIIMHEVKSKRVQYTVY